MLFVCHFQRGALQPGTSLTPPASAPPPRRTRTGGWAPRACVPALVLLPGPQEAETLPTPASSPQCGRPGFDSWVGKIPWRRKWQPTLVFLPGESHRQRSLAAYSPWGLKESDMTDTYSHSHRILLLFSSWIRLVDDDLKV